MKGLVIEKPGVITIKNDIPYPKMSDYAAVVETIACGICNGTDLKLLDGHFKGYSTYPMVLGHESVGKVIELGAKVRNYKKGDHVMRSVLDSMEPLYYSGWGSFAEFNVVYDYRAMVEDGVPNVNEYYVAQQVVPPDIDPVKATMIITFKEVLTGLTSFGVGKDHTVMINGCGPVGLSMVRLAKALGVKLLFVSDIDERRLKLAGKLGADVILNPASEDVEAAVRSRAKDGLDFFIDAVGINKLMNLGLNLVKFNGKICVYGISPACESSINWEKAPYNWTLQFVQWPNVMTEATLHDQVIEYVRKKYLNLDDFVTHILPLEQYAEGIDLVKKKEALKVALTLR